jgi:hypothetical protein
MQSDVFAVPARLKTEFILILKTLSTAGEYVVVCIV